MESIPISATGEMNLSTYIFQQRDGNEASWFPSSPGTEAESIVSDNISNLGSAPELLVCRRDSLVRYYYLTRVANGVFGYLFILNDVYIANIRPLVLWCRDLTDVIAMRSMLLTWKDHGICLAADSLNDNSISAQSCIDSMSNLSHDSIFSQAIPLPTLDHSLSTDSETIDFTNGVKEIPPEYRGRKSLRILLPPPVRTALTAINGLNKKVSDYSELNDELKKSFTELSRQKKRMKWVVILSLLLVAGAIGLISVNSDLKRTRVNLSDMSNRADFWESESNQWQKKAEYLAEDKDILINQIGEAEKVIDFYRHLAPFKITSWTLSYKWNDSYWTGTPSPNTSPWLMFTCNYESKEFEEPDYSQLPSIRHANDDSEYPNGENLEESVEAEEAPAESPYYLNFVCYYKAHGKSTWEMTLTDYFNVDVSQPSGSFFTRQIDCGFQRLPAGEYRAEIWYDSVCLGYKSFSI